MYLTLANQEYSPQRWAKTIDGDHQWLSENDWTLRCRALHFVCCLPVALFACGLHPSLGYARWERELGFTAQSRTEAPQVVMLAFEHNDFKT
ncbi:hypothetical protein QL285_061080 [Trifolium repens]|jgi:hypothetical protein|nr:hypothetical protein QL285_061061 [Trifolium repens]KAK2387284.1 hypothetical protein QL285_061080 [Trifolium repens]